MHIKTKIELSSAEIAGLWTAYMNDSAAVHVIEYFLKYVDDGQVKPILQYALDLSKKHIKKISQYFNEEKIPIPQGFTESDIDVNAPRLYTDNFYLFYLRNIGILGTTAYSLALSTCARSDIRDYFTGCLGSSVELSNKVSDILLSKGLFVRAPSVEVPKQVSFIEKEDFLDDILGKKRPLLTVEIAHIYGNTLTNLVGRALLMGFGQVTNSNEIKKFMFRGMDIASKHIEVFNSLLSQENIPVPSTSNAFVTDSTISPFTNKLMMFHVNALNAAGIGNYSAGMIASLRKDLHANYLRMSAEIGQFVDDGTKIMIRNGWLEQPPQAINHKTLANV